MAEIIRMPRLSDTMEEGTIIGWMKQVGDVVKPGDVLAEVETDKATMELENFIEGTLLHIGVPEGVVPVDAIIAVIGEQGEDVEALLKDAAAATPAPEAKTEESKPAPTPPPVSAPKAAPAPAPTPQVDNSRILASPLAKKMAHDANIDISHVSGTGAGGRVIKKDIEAFLANGGTKAAATPVMMQQNLVSDFEYGTFPVSQMRKTIARRLGESKYQAPHFYLTVEIDMENAMAARKMLNEGEENRISYNDLVVKAAAAALRKHPKINASWNGDSITYHQDINVGVAVAIEEGLIVPVIRNTDLKSLNTIYDEIRDLAGKAKAKKLPMEQMTGNTFTISNLGMFGIEEFTAIINPPDACILAVGTIVEKPVVKNGQIVVGHGMKVTLSCDHRIVDGAKGAAFLATFKEYMEQPMKMLR